MAVIWGKTVTIREYVLNLRISANFLAGMFGSFGESFYLCTRFQERRSGATGTNRAAALSAQDPGHVSLKVVTPE